MSIQRKHAYVILAILAIILASIAGWKCWQQHKYTPAAGNYNYVLPPAAQDRPPNGVPILMYHKIDSDPGTGGLGLRVTPDNFDWQMKYLKENGYHTVNIGSVIDYYQRNGALSEKPVVITFDDGYRNNYRYAYPILERYGFTATIFIVTNTVGGINEFDYKLHLQPKNQMLTWDEIKEMDRSGITIGSHTLDHVHLTSVSLDEAKRQITESKKVLEQKLGHNIEYFCYPYGEYNNDIANIVKESGYVAAATTNLGLVKSAMNPYLLNRIRITGYYDHQKFIDELHKY